MTTKKINEKKSKKSNKDYLTYAFIGVVIILLIVFYAKKSDIGQDSTVVATVNGEDITQYDIVLQRARLGPQMQGMISDDVLLNQTIAEMLIIQEAKKTGIVVSDKDVDELIDTLKTQSGIDDAQYKELLAKQNLTEKDAKDLYKRQLYMAKLVNSTVLQDTSVTEEELKDFYNSNKDMFEQDEQVKAAHILIKVDDSRTDEEAKKLIEQIKSEVTKDNFGELVAKYSEDPGSVGNEGEYTFGRGVMVKEFEDAAFSLDVGGMKIVKTQFGYHLIKLLETIPAGIASFEDVKDQLEASLLVQKQQEKLKEYVLGLIADADIKIIRTSASSADTGEIIAPSQGESSLGSFQETGDEICKKGELPIVSVFTTSTCPHCKLIGPTIDKLLGEYKGQIVAYHYQLDTGDDLLTEEVETQTPDDALALYKKYNPQGYVPSFVFGCKFMRIGNAYEDDLSKEKQEFKTVIDALL